MKRSIQRLCVKHGCDKTPEISHAYAPVYDRILGERSNIKSVLEIGVGYPERMNRYVNILPNRVRDYDYKTGASLYVWRDYFPEAMIYGIDIDERASVVGEDRIKTFFCNSTDPEQVADVMGRIGRPDIIIDDGSHRLEDQIKTAKLFLPYVAKGGLYFIEDVLSTRMIVAEFDEMDVEVLVRNKSDGLVLIRR